MHFSAGANVSLSPTGECCHTTASPSTFFAPSTPLPLLRVLVLLSDGFGGFGGIAKFNRDFLTALCSHPRIQEVIALPRLMPHDAGVLPPKLHYVTSSLGGKARFMRAVLESARRLGVRKSSPVTRGTYDSSGPLGVHSDLSNSALRLGPSRPLDWTGINGEATNKRKNGKADRDEKSSSSSSPVSSLDTPCIIICGHIHLLPAALLARKICGGTVHLIVHGIDAWQPSKNPLTNACVRRIDGFIAVSDVTKQRFMGWSRVPSDRGRILPNCVDLFSFTPGPKPPALLKRYDLCCKKVIMTLGRLASEERFKGFDEVLEVLPALAAEIPGLCYLIVGDGADRARLMAKAKSFGCDVMDMAKLPSLSPTGRTSGRESLDQGQLLIPTTPFSTRPRVIFAGRISDSEKADHYRLADAYVMPSSGEGFGIVYLEALACGIPVIGSKADGSREALRDGKLGTLVDPRNSAEIVSAVVGLLKHGKEMDHPPRSGENSIEYFSFDRFQNRAHAIIDTIAPPVSRPSPGDPELVGFRDPQRIHRRSTEACPPLCR